MRLTLTGAREWISKSMRLPGEQLVKAPIPTRLTIGLPQGLYLVFVNGEKPEWGSKDTFDKSPHFITIFMVLY